MKKLSDYKGEEAIELWADLLDPVTAILGNKATKELFAKKKGITLLEMAQSLLKENSADVKKILLRIDDTPLDGFNIISRLRGLLQEFQSSKEMRGFFGFAEQEKTEDVSSGSATESTEADAT